MARLNFVKKARKDYPEHDIKNGESYFWWKFRKSGKYYSKMRPRRSRLTQSEFLSTMYDAEDDLAQSASDCMEGKTSIEDVASACDDAANAVRDAGEQCTDNRSNMPDSLQDSETWQLLETRSEQCEAIASEIETAAQEIRAIEIKEDDSDEDKEAKREEAAQHVEGISWDYE